MSYDDLLLKEKLKLKRMSTEKLMEERKTYNPTFKRYARLELQRRGALKKKIRSMSPLQKVDSDIKRMLGAGF